MKKLCLLFIYFVKERYQFMLISVLSLFMVETYIFFQFTPYENISYDYLLIIGYLVFGFLIFMNAYRFNRNVFGRTHNYFNALPVNGTMILVSYGILSAIEFVFYFVPLFYFISLALTEVPGFLPLALQIKRIHQYAFMGFWQTWLIYIVFLLLAYFSIIFKKKDFQFFALFIPLIAILVVFRFWFQTILKIVFTINPIFLLPYSPMDIYFYGTLLIVFFVINGFALNQRFSK